MARAHNRIATVESLLTAFITSSENDNSSDDDLNTARCTARLLSLHAQHPVPSVTTPSTPSTSMGSRSTTSRVNARFFGPLWRSPASAAPLPSLPFMLINASLAAIDFEPRVSSRRVHSLRAPRQRTSASRQQLENVDNLLSCFEELQADSLLHCDELLALPSSSSLLSAPASSRAVREQSADPAPHASTVVQYCTFPNCTRKNLSQGCCTRHGGGQRCTVSGCINSAKKAGKCTRHAGDPFCTVDGCLFISRVAGKCQAHSVSGSHGSSGRASKQAGQSHVAPASSKRRCRMETCGNVAHVRGGAMCSYHES